MKFLDSYKKNYSEKKQEVYTVEEYLKAAAKDSSFYATAAERMLKAIGEPELVDTSKDPRLSRIHGNRIVKHYKTFSDFYGMENVLEAVVSYFTHAAQGLEEKNQILYLLGPVGSAKSSLAERLKKLMEVEPIFILAFQKDDELEISPIFESPLGLLSEDDSEVLNIHKRYLKLKPSPWAIKRLRSVDGDLTHFRVIKAYPSFVEQRSVAVVVAGDENTQDISTLVGKGSLRKIEFYEQNDPDCYSYCGGLCTGNQGIIEFVEMFKADIDTLNPLLTATQEHYYEPTEKIGVLPFDGVVLAHSNEKEWNDFKSDKKNVAILDRIYIVEVPYCTRVSEEVKIYRKLLDQSSLNEAPCAPQTLELLAQFSVLSRLDPVLDREGRLTASYSKMKVYDGENEKNKDVTVKSLQAYKQLATRDEGFNGVSTRLAYKVLSEVFNYDSREVAADPVHLFEVLKKMIPKERLPKDKANAYEAYIKGYLEPEYLKAVTKDLQECYVDSANEFGQNTFDRYVMYADHWVQDNDFRDPDTGQMFDRAVLNEKLEKLEKPAGISNPKDFRNEVVNFSLRYQAKHDGKNPDWKSYAKLRKVIEANMFDKMDDLLPIISFGKHQSKDHEEKHKNFVTRMKDKGYTETQVRRVVEWVESQKNQ